MGEIIFHVFLMAVLGIFYNETFSINTARMTDPIGPAGFPQIIIIASFILLAVSLRNAVKKFRVSRGETRGKIKEFDLGFLALMVTIVGFIMLVDMIGFWVASVILISVILIILGQRKVPRIVAITLCASLVFTIVFGRVLSVPLPRGFGIFKLMSYFLY